MEERYYIYRHINKINDKQYIGITRQSDPEMRWGKNGLNYGKNTYFGNAIRKYGWDNFEHEILEVVDSKEEACKKEQEYIARFNTADRNCGYNSTLGGDYFIMNSESRQKVSEAMRGNTNGLGKPCSEEKKEKIASAQRGRTFTEEHKNKLSQAAKNRSRTACSEETKKKLSERYPHKKPVYCFETNIVYPSVQECARQLDLQATLLVKCLKGKIKSTKGMHFTYYHPAET